MIKVIVGAANFFQKYGITQEESSTIKIEKILKACSKFQIKIIDTAISYEIEPQKIFISKDILSKFVIGTKIPIKNLDPKRTNFLDDLLFSLNKSLIQWKKEKFEYIYCHDLLVKNEDVELFNIVFNKLKSEGFTESIGLSVYDLKDINKQLLPIIDRIQIPDNLYLQRSHNEILFLKSLSKIIDVRSIFLQGVIPNESINFKKRIPSELFDHHCKALSRSKDIGLEMYDLAIQFIKKQNYSNLVIGVDDSTQINKFYKSFTKKIEEINFGYFKLNSKFIDPRLW